MPDELWHSVEPFLFKHLAEQGARGALQPEESDDGSIFDKETNRQLLQSSIGQVSHIWAGHAQGQSSGQNTTSQMLTRRTYIDPDFERLATVFQTYFSSVEDSFVYINSRLDFAGITIDDLKKALVRLRLARAPPFSCFFLTVYGYNFGRMWRRAGAPTEKHPLTWANFDRAFRWHSHSEDEAPDIIACFSRRSSILNYVVRKIIDFDKLAQSEASRVQMQHEKALKLTVHALSERSMAVFRLESIIDSLRCAIREVGDESDTKQRATNTQLDLSVSILYPQDDEYSSSSSSANLKRWVEEVAAQGIYALLCQARRELLTLGFVYTPPSFDLCDDAPSTCQTSASHIHGSEPSELPGQAKKQYEGDPLKYEDQKTVVICELHELQGLLRSIISNPDLSYNTVVESVSPRDHAHTEEVRDSTLSMLRQCRQEFTLGEYPVREDRDMKRWLPQRPESQVLARQRFCRRRMNTRLLPRPVMLSDLQFLII